MSNESIDIQTAKRVIRMEAESVAALEKNINASFQRLWTSSSAAKAALL
jgi:hypothetical protein